MKRRILVCGATGFIGRNVAERLARRDDLEVHAVRLTRPAFEAPAGSLVWHQADLTRAEEADRLLAGMDAVVQAAAVTSGVRDAVTRPHIHITDNAVMNALLLRAAFEQRVGRFVFFSCSVMLPSGERPWTEAEFDANAPIHPRYFGPAWTKLYGEKMCEFYAAQGRTRHTVIRHSNVYGPHDKFDLERSHVFGATVTKAMTAADGRLTVWGSGEEARDLLYIDDLTDFVERALDRQETPFELVNVGSGHAVPVKELVRRIAAAAVAAGRPPLEIVHDLSAPSIPTSLSLDCARARALFGWEPRVGLDEGIARTIDWWRRNIGPTVA